LKTDPPRDAWLLCCCLLLLLLLLLLLRCRRRDSTYRNGLVIT
jgi:hypothetical protein